MSTIKELEQEYLAAKDALFTAKQRLLAARRAALPFKEGEVVEAEFRYQQWEPAIIRWIDVRADGDSIYHGARKTKAGWSKRTQYIGAAHHLRKAPALSKQETETQPSAAALTEGAS